MWYEVDRPCLAGLGDIMSPVTCRARDDGDALLIGCAGARLASVRLSVRDAEMTDSCET
jgi:hypothetical protein